MNSTRTHCTDYLFRNMVQKMPIQYKTVQILPSIRCVYVSCFSPPRLVLESTKNHRFSQVVRRLRTIERIVSRIGYSASPPDPSQEITFRHRYKKRRKLRALCYISTRPSGSHTPSLEHPTTSGLYAFYGINTSGKVLSSNYVRCAQHLLPRFRGRATE